jgi:VWFA-related protein
MKASLACLFLAFGTLHVFGQQNTQHLATTTSSDARSSLDVLTAVRMVRSVTEVNLVFTVTRGKRLVDNLRQDELEILDNGEPPARLTRFEAKTNLPLRLALLLDTSDSVRGRFKFEQASAIAFLKHVLRPGDLAMVVGFNEHPRLSQALTGDPRLLSQSIKKLKPGGDTAVFDALSFAAQRLGQADDQVPVRKLIVLLSDGQENSSARDLEKAINEAWHLDVSIVSISSNQKDACRSDPLCAQGEVTLKSVADSTGGEFLRAADEAGLWVAFNKIANELRKEYAVSYRPAFETPDGLFHSVIISARRGTRVHCRKGYYAKLSPKSP